MDVGKSRAILPVFAGAGSYEIRLSLDEINVDLSMFEQLEDRPSVTYWPTSATSLVPMPTSSRYKKIIQDHTLSFFHDRGVKVSILWKEIISYALREIARVEAQIEHTENQITVRYTIPK